MNTEPKSAVSSNGVPVLRNVEPRFALPGGEIRIFGHGLMPKPERPLVHIGEESASVVFGSDTLMVARVPEEATGGPLTVETAVGISEPADVRVAVPIAENLHPVANPAVDSDGNMFATFSGARGQAVPVSIFRIDGNFNVHPFLTGLMNATGLALDIENNLYVSSRNDGTVYKVTPFGELSTYAQGMGVATGIAFDGDGNLYVGDRSGTIFKIARDRQIFVLATLEPSVAAYHLAFAPNGNLYVTGPTTSSNDAIYEVDPHGDMTVYYRGLGRPQGLAFDTEGNLYVVASYKGRRGVVRFTSSGEPSLVVSGNALVGLAFAPEGAMVLATNSGLNFL
ncbi:MAG TPA: IPT/TIG domain-containing protein, partial [Candidatus Acidoferrales bacterium]|nr:IPT/TIG domain-containing protein [Candidatus Acidoferrales bacterium]